MIRRSPRVTSDSLYNIPNDRVDSPTAACNWVRACHALMSRHVEEKADGTLLVDAQLNIGAILVAACAPVLVRTQTRW